ncbi:MAG: hypothetical protein ACREH5_02130, partial [Candidatus Omnitrophota bacterium]
MKRVHLTAIFFSVFALTVTSAISHAATIMTKAAFNGQAPAAEAIKADADPNCALLHPQGIAGDAVVVNTNGTLKNVFVYVKEGLAGKTFEAPKT